MDGNREVYGVLPDEDPRGQPKRKVGMSVERREEEGKYSREKEGKMEGRNWEEMRKRRW